MKLILLIETAAISIFAQSCRAQDKTVCQPALFDGHVKHHSLKIPNSRVFIKKGSLDMPGLYTNLYDIRVQADGNAHYSLSGLEKGDYYILAIGYDSAISNAVRGGIPATISCDPASKTYNIDLPVVE
ncbi:MAG: hypothetical protein H7257_02725 [Taibaiella sp.]|nr:hypothetical protein [Taibaiella sp.]